MLSEEFVFQVEKEVEEGLIKKRWKMCSNSRTFSSMIFFIIINVNIRISLRVPRLILWALKLTIIKISGDYEIYKTRTGNLYEANLEPDSSQNFFRMILEIMFGCYSMLSNLQQQKVHFLLNHPWIPPVITKLWPASIRQKSYGKTIFVPGPSMGIVCPTHIPLPYFSMHHETVMNI
jgi:hypothetical protein